MPQVNHERNPCLLIALCRALKAPVTACAVTKGWLRSLRSRKRLHRPPAVEEWKLTLLPVTIQWTGVLTIKAPVDALSRTKESSIVVSPSRDQSCRLIRLEAAALIKRYSNNGDSTKICGSHPTLSPEYENDLVKETSAKTPTRHKGVKFGPADLCYLSSALI